MKILLAVTGSVAAVKGPEIAVRLVKELDDATTATVKVLLTAGGKHFWSHSRNYNTKYWKLLQEEISNGTISIIYADDEWKKWNILGDPVMHIDLRDEADIFVICPLSAHCLAKLASGLCDDTMSCVARAWDYGHGTRPGKPMILAPAMNTAMWDHPVTQPQLKTIQSFWNSKRDPINGIRIVSPQTKVLACGEHGNGALASVDDIISEIREALGIKIGATTTTISR